MWGVLVCGGLWCVVGCGDVWCCTVVCGGVAGEWGLWWCVMAWRGSVGWSGVALGGVVCGGVGWCGTWCGDVSGGFRGFRVHG